MSDVKSPFIQFGDITFAKDKILFFRIENTRKIGVNIWSLVIYLMSQGEHGYIEIGLQFSKDKIVEEYKKLIQLLNK